MLHLTDKEQLAWLELDNNRQHDNGAIKIHPHNPNEWSRYLIFKSLVRKGWAEVDYNDAACIVGWVAEFYDREYYKEVV